MVNFDINIAWNNQLKDYKGYNGSTKLKAAGVQIEWLPEMLEEYLKCKEDPVYFIQKYMKIIIKGVGLRQIDLYPYQKKMIQNLKDNRFNIFATARQAGKSVAVCGFILWLVLFSDTRPLVAFLANKGGTAREILGKVKLAFEHVPIWLQQGIIEWNKGSIEFENGSRIVAEATSSDSIRGYSIDFLFIDEAAFVENWDEFFVSTLNTIISTNTTKIVLVSTPKGLNHFYEYWDKAEKEENEYVPLKVTWREVPGRDEKWRVTALKAVNNDMIKFAQEHEVEFIGSSATLILGNVLKALQDEAPIYSSEFISQYCKPEANHMYTLIADVGEGKGLDYSAFQVIDITTNPFRLVCSYRNNLITPAEYADIILNIANAYNKAWVLVENNNIGGEVCNILHQTHEYESIIRTQSAGPAGKKVSSGFGDVKSELGIRTTKTVKATGCSLIKMLVEQNQIYIPDMMTIRELRRFSKKANTYQAEEGATDDLVMCLVLFGWLSAQTFFKDLTDINVLDKLKDRNEKQVQEELTPFCTVYDGQPETDAKELLGNNSEGWVLDNDYEKKVRIHF